MIELIEYKAEHAEILCPQAVDETVKNSEWRKWAEANEFGGVGFTGIYQGQMLFAAGIRRVRDGVGDMWAVITPQARQCLKDVIRSQRVMLGIVALEMNLKRLRADSRIGFKESQRLLEAMGFTKKRVMLNKTHFYYAKVI